MKALNLESAVMNHRLPPRELRLLVVLHRLCAANGTTTATQSTLGRLTGIAQAAVGPRVQRLVKCGLVEKTDWHDGKSRRFKYRLVDADGPEAA